ncbi:Cell surface superoxide dismutase [Cu-Zn] 6 [Cyberlindnera fabianii]|uniref:Cell surface superoxide dismutase [Cu-Zn] 6 n=1 Tax=Cyberlindnera fabianii TaxID=36022 RepID=A0A1V2LD07_CYBFA|nr:Cell surface superoxide dismutase [Cu-Zn] 6 [Cyberlindnera fabianii]
MKVIHALSLLASAASVISALPVSSAEPIENNPTDVVLRADFPQGNSQTVVGVIQFYSLNGTTKVHVDITGLPKNSGMFTYHIHEKPVGADKSCAATGAHFNPFGASADCEALGDDALCEIGDLSGKHGLINTTCFELFYYDPYLSLDPSSPQYIGNRAINIHLENGARLACATIKPSREPEDLLLLNAESEAEEVRKFEEIAGITHAHSSNIQSTAVSEPQFEEPAAAAPFDVVSPEAPSEEAGEPLLSDELTSLLDVDEESEAEGEAEYDLEEVFEDDELTKDASEISNRTLSNVSNSTDYTNVTGSEEEEDEENRATSLSSGLMISVGVAMVLGFMW